MDARTCSLETKELNAFNLKLGINKLAFNVKGQKNYGDIFRNIFIFFGGNKNKVLHDFCEIFSDLRLGKLEYVHTKI